MCQCLFEFLNAHALFPGSCTAKNLPYKYTCKCMARKEKCTRMFPAALVATDTNWKPVKRFSITIWLHTLRDSHTREFCDHLKGYGQGRLCGLAGEARYS